MIKRASPLVNTAVLGRGKIGIGGSTDKNAYATKAKLAFVYVKMKPEITI